MQVKLSTLSLSEFNKPSTSNMFPNNDFRCTLKKILENIKHEENFQSTEDKQKTFQWLGNERIAAFHNRVSSINSLSGEIDKMVWQKDIKGLFFSVCSAYKDLNSSNLQEESWSWKMIWKRKCLVKLNSFTRL